MQGVGLQEGEGAGLTLPEGCSGWVHPGRVLVPMEFDAGQPAPASPAWSRGLDSRIPSHHSESDSSCHVECHLSHLLAAGFFPLLLGLGSFFVCFQSPVSNGAKIRRTIKWRDRK